LNKGGGGIRQRSDVRGREKTEAGGQKTEDEGRMDGRDRR